MLLAAFFCIPRQNVPLRATEFLIVFPLDAAASIKPFPKRRPMSQSKPIGRTPGGASINLRLIFGRDFLGVIDHNQVERALFLFQL